MRNVLLRFKAKALLAVLMLISLYSSAQNESWQEKMADPSVNIYEVKQSFEQAWLNKPITKGKGYKQYKRWEYFMDARCFPTGVRFAPDAVAVAMDQQPEMFAFNSEMPGSWTYIGNTSVPTGGGGAGRVNSVRPMPGSTTTFFACAPAGGLWKTTNSGVSWSLMNTDGLASIGVSDVAIDPNNTNIMYIATGDGDAGDTYALGVLKTTDGGLTWNTTGLSWAVTNNRTTSRLLIDPSDSQKVIAATSNGIYRTINGGTSWTQVQTGSFKDLDFHPSNPLIVYATGSSYFRSADGGATWTNITSGLPTTDVTRMALAVSANNSSYVYILAGKSSDAGMRGVYRSTDAGLSFTAQYTGPLNLMGWDPAGTDAGGQAWYDLVIEADPSDANVIYTGGVNVWKSSNGGTSWALSGHWYGGGGAPYVHADIHAMAFVPGTTRLLVGCDGGVFTTTNGGPNFSDISSNLQISQQYRLSVSQTNANLVLSGWQDNGTNLKNGSTWTRPIGGDGMECIINPSNSSIMYGEIYYGNIRKSTNGGVSFPTQVCGSGGTGVNENGAWVTPYVLGSDPAHLYVGKTRVYKSTDNGATFTSLAAFGTGVINALCVAPANNNYIYASKGGTLYKSIDNGATFSTVTGLPGNYITYICTNSSNAQEVYVTVSGFNSGVKVYKSTNAGTSWTNISGALPNIPANCIVYQTGSASNALYVGTDAGVFYRDDVIGNWVPYMNGMPNVVVDELEIQYNTNTIVAATYGRGTWSAPLYALPQRDVTIAAITSPSGTTCESLIAPTFEILNAGENTVNAVTFSYQVNANTALTYTWNGSLASGGTATVTPPTYDYGNGAFTLTVNITDVNGLGTDENTGNNSSTVPYYVSGGTNSVTLNLLTDCYPEETSWSVTQGGVTIFQGAGYAGATNNSVTMCLDDGCFALNIFDSYGDGLSSCATGDFELVNDANGAILATMSVANFGFQSTNNFCLNLPTPGCTNNTACNYNPAATTDDGTCVFGPANDICSNATSFTINGGAVTAINTGTCNNAANPTCGGATAIKDIWYKFVYTGGDITIQTSAGSSTGVAALTDTRIAVYASCGGTQIACNDDISGTNYYSSIALTCAQLTVGNTYYVQLGGYNGLTGVCSLNITRADVLGCTNPLATNYNACATVDNGTCTGLSVPGCNNVTACNYNSAATVDDGSCVLPTTYYRDIDGDTYGNAAQTIQACSAPAGYVSNSTDCNDNNAAVRPGATEVCNSIDDDCDTSIDEGVQLTFYRDLDGDTYGNAAQTIQACSAPAGYVSNSTDCNDNNAAVRPGAAETCNSIDDDCDTSIDEGVQLTFYRDLDGDTYGNAAQTIQACSAPAGYVSNSTDCNDNNAAVRPGATETCNSIDDDCDTSIDEGVQLTFYLDLDGDTYGNAAQTIQACSAPAGYVSNSTDCNDNSSAINPGATETCNGINDDCDGLLDEGCGITYASNDSPSAAQTVTVGTLYSCNGAVTGDLANASPSSESLIACVTGEDLWYSFTALTPGVRIQVISAQNNIVIELQDSNGDLINSEDINSGLGNEILNFGGLITGNQYFVAIRNFNSNQGIGTFSLCISKLQQTMCDYPGPNFSLCDWYKANYVGAYAYVFHFTPLDGGSEISVTKYGSTILPLTNVPGLQYEHSYDVSIDAVYQLANGLAQPEFITVAGSSVCDLNLGSPNLPGLRTNDQCPNTKQMFSYIQLTPAVCGASVYAWEVTRVDIPQLPVVVQTINSKFLQLRPSNGFVQGGVYNVRVSAVFGNNPPSHYGPSQCVQMIGSAGMVLGLEENEIMISEEPSTDLELYPNPANSEINILPLIDLSENVWISIIDQMGKVVFTKKIVNYDGSAIRIDLPSSLSNGLYLVQIDDQVTTIKRKIIIEK